MTLQKLPKNEPTWQIDQEADPLDGLAGVTDAVIAEAM
jgi:hypothetical protein